MSTYSEKLKDPRWQKKRLEILERDNYTCTGCGIDGRYKDKESGLMDYCEMHIHHIKYKKNAMPWEYDDDELTTLCYACHKRLHIKKKRACEKKRREELGIPLPDKDYYMIGELLPKNLNEFKKYLILWGDNNG